MRKKEKTKLLRLLAACRDMAHAKDAAAKFRSTANEDLRYHLFTSLIIAYCRPFTQNNGLGSLFVDFPEYEFRGIKRSGDKYVRHDRMWELRNSFIAHGEISGLKVFLVPPNVPSPISKRVLPYADVAIGTRTFLDPRFLEWLLPGIIALENRVNRELQPLLEKHGKGDVTIELNGDANNFSRSRSKAAKETKTK